MRSAVVATRCIRCRLQSHPPWLYGKGSSVLRHGVPLRRVCTLWLLVLMLRQLMSESPGVLLILILPDADIRLLLGITSGSRGGIHTSRAGSRGRRLCRRMNVLTRKASEELGLMEIVGWGNVYS